VLADDSAFPTALWHNSVCIAYALAAIADIARDVQEIKALLRGER